MVQPDQSSLRNQLLRALAPEDFALVGPYLEPVALPKGKVLIEPNQPIEYVYFAESGVASVVALNSDYRPVEIAIVGWEGLVGPSVILGVDRTPHQSFFQMEGEGYRIATSHLTQALEASRTLLDLLLRYIHVVTVQTAATAMSNGDSVLSERLARWLLMCHDRVEGNELALTHEFLSLMLAVRRPGVTEAIHLLEGTGMIRARRANITILDRERLEETAGDSYGVPEAEYERLIPNPEVSGGSHFRRGPREIE
ncbi:Crp/Fnr family transcriptional regulator [Microvirga sp. 2MCAF35]|uniref:Crp/Fnr family transcriptional regulator n=1 Tax=Microvirga sp. 2MCAF35 TaxID=3232987 RepID=UPI003F98256A